MKVYRNPFFYFVIILAVGFVFSVVRAAFTEPTNSFPGSAPASPLDTSSLTQTKVGGLYLSSGFLGVNTTNLEGRTVNIFGTLKASGLGEFGNIYALGQESRFSYGTYVDPHEGTAYAIKIGAGGIASIGNAIFLGGNVGIGTANPKTKLEVIGTASSTEVCISGDCKTSWPAATPSQWTSSSSGIFYNSWNVGIGTASLPCGTPGCLEVGITANFSGPVHIKNSDAANLWLTSANDSSRIVFGLNGDQYGGQILYNYDAVRGNRWRFINGWTSSEVVMFSRGGVLLNAMGAPQPTCDSGNRGLVFFVPGSTGQWDDLYICRKKNDGSYEWKKLT